MKRYGGIDVHSNNSVVALLDEADRVVYRKRLPTMRRACWRPRHPTTKPSWVWGGVHLQLGW
jgi:hypothetical protein